MLIECALNFLIVFHWQTPLVLDMATSSTLPVGFKAVPCLSLDRLNVSNVEFVASKLYFWLEVGPSPARILCKISTSKS